MQDFGILIGAISQKKPEISGALKVRNYTYTLIFVLIAVLRNEFSKNTNTVTHAKKGILYSNIVICSFLLCDACGNCLHLKIYSYYNCE